MSFPPGLELDAAAIANDKLKTKMLDEVAGEMRNVAIESIESELRQLGDGNSHEGVISKVREVVLADVDASVKAKAEELWLKGQGKLSSIQAKHKEKTQALAEDLADCLKKQQAMEAENERLKQVLAGLVSHFQMLGTVFSAPNASVDSGSLAGDRSTVASTMSPNREIIASQLLTPGAAESEAADIGLGEPAAAAKLPEVPAFPFPASAPSPPLRQPSPVLCLADHLLQNPQPLSIASSLALAPTPETKNAGDSAAGPDTFTYSFTLRKAHGTDLGLNVSHHEQDKILRVEGVRPEGAVEAWNRQCASSVFAEKAVRFGDTITSVNNIMLDPKKMLEECRDKQLLKIIVVRQLQPSRTSVPNVQLRAEASEFVPCSATPATLASPDESKQLAASSEAETTLNDAAHVVEENPWQTEG